MNATEKSHVSQIAVHCFDCYHGRYELVTRDEEYPMTNGTRITLPRVNYLRCIDCGEEILTTESDQYLQSFGPPMIDLQALREEDEAKSMRAEPTAMGCCT